MSTALRVYVDFVFSARDALLKAGIEVIEYDFYPGELGVLFISDADRDSAVRALSAWKIPFTFKPPTGDQRIE